MDHSFNQQVTIREEARAVPVVHPLEESTLWGGGMAKIAARFAETILLVEDEAFVRAVTCEVLQSAGYRVWTARNATEAEQIYAERGSEVDLLLTDVILPGETGLVLAARMRRENPPLRVLFVTGYVEEMGLRETREECLAKPFSSEVLLQRVRQVLDRSQLSN